MIVKFQAGCFQSLLVTAQALVLNDQLGRTPNICNPPVTFGGKMLYQSLEPTALIHFDSREFLDGLRQPQCDEWHARSLREIPPCYRGYAHG